MADKETSALTAGTDPKAALFVAVQAGHPALLRFDIPLARGYSFTKPMDFVHPMP